MCVLSRAAVALRRWSIRFGFEEAHPSYHEPSVWSRAYDRQESAAWCCGSPGNYAAHRVGCIATPRRNGVETGRAELWGGARAAQVRCILRQACFLKRRAIDAATYS